MLSLSVQSCVDRFILWCEQHRRPKTADHYRYQLGRFADRFGRRRVTSLTPALLASWSANFHPVQAVQRLCSWLLRVERSIKSNPLAGMSKPRMGQRRRVLDRAALVRLLRAADRCFRAVLLTLRETMCRPQEARALTWADRLGGADRGQPCDEVKLRDDWFQLPTAKGFEWRSDQSAERVIPISPRLARLLDRLSRRAVTLTSPILLDSRGRPWTSNAIRCRFRRLRLRAGLGADRRGEKVVAYTLRHTGATAAAAAGVGTWMLAGLLGHASPRTTERYVHPQPADLIDAMGVVWERKTPRNPKNGRRGSSRNRLD